MSTYDGVPPDEPIDLAAVSADDELVEALRRSLSPDAAVVWDDDDEDVDPAFALLRVLQRDVSADLPAAGPLLPRGVTALVPGARRFGRTATVALVAAGVLSVGGVAAAASAPGQPLAGVRHSISVAVRDVVQAMTPDLSRHSKTARPTHEASPTAKPHGPAVSTAAGSAVATAQVAAGLQRAERLLVAGHYAAARDALDSAARTLPLVLDTATHRALADQLASLRSRLAAADHPAATEGPRQHGSEGGLVGDQGNHGSQQHEPGADVRTTSDPNRTQSGDHGSNDTTGNHGNDKGNGSGKTEPKAKPTKPAKKNHGDEQQVGPNQTDTHGGHAKPLRGATDKTSGVGTSSEHGQQGTTGSSSR